MEYRLEELFDLQMGKTPSRSVTEYWESGNNKWISIADLSKCGKYIYDTKECLSDIAVSESGIKQIPANTVVMSFKLSIGKTAITSEPMYSNEAIMSFRDRKLVQLLPEYIYYLLLSKNWDDGTNKAVMGKTLNKATLSKVKVNIHSMQEQQEIVYVLNQATALIELHQQQLQKLDELVKARFVELFGDPVGNPKAYYVATLQELICKGYITYHLDGNHGGDYPKSDEFVETGIPYISANCIVNGEVDFAKAKYLTSERANKLRKGIAQNGDVLFAHNATVGPTVVLHTTEKKVILGTSLTAYRCDKEKILPNYLKTYMLSDGFVRQYSNEMKQTTRNQVPITAQKRYLFLIPPIELQNQFATFVEQVDKSKVAVQKSLDEAQLLFDSLMQQYFG